MPWFRVDDTLALHPKVVRAGNAAMGLWVRAGTWSMQQLTDGQVPREMVSVLGGRPADARRLVEAGLWLELDDGYCFHQWEDRQPTRSEVETKRAAEAERKRLGREAAKARREESAERPAGQSADVRPDKVRSPARPDPTRPDPTPSTTSGGAAAPPRQEPNTQAIIAEWIDSLDVRPPSRTIGQLSKEVRQLLDEGQPYADVQRAVGAWQAKGLNPSTLASVLHETRSRRKAQPAYPDGWDPNNAATWGDPGPWGDARFES